jgi:translation initiation factor 2B subunit (eIF-2B alpha/beta/delta family)
MRRRVAALARDRVSGATALARRAALLLRSAARDDGRGLGRWQRDLRALGEAVAAAQPAMGSVLTVVETARRAAEGARTVGVGARAVRRAICLTLSSSEVVYRALLAARRRGRLARVVVAESRPGCEGVALARRLAARGVPVSVVVDALAPAIAAKVDAVVLGADAVTRTALWNKCGSFGVALAAAAGRRPTLVVTTGDRLLAPRLARRLALVEAEPHGVLSPPTRGVRVINRLFDRTPLRLVTLVVTEAGAMEPAAVKRRLGVGRT